ncbi:MAG: lytic transglycosylase domain-containing protein [Pseudomonadota bacterium]
MNASRRLSIAALAWSLPLIVIGALLIVGVNSGRLPTVAIVGIGGQDPWTGFSRVHRDAWLNDDAMDPWREHIQEASERFDIPAAWIAAIMRVESRGLTHWDGSPVVSDAGAVGLMQVLPDTYAVMRQRYDLGPDPHEPRDNILAGTAYLGLLYEIYGYPGFVGAYNAGPGRYGAHIFHDGELPGQTEVYMEQILPHIAGIYPGGDGHPRPPSREAYDRLVASAL